MSVALHPQTHLPITALVGADYNPRVMPDESMRALMRSLREFGFVEPVVARAEDNLILGGHQRVGAMQRIAQEDGLDPASVMVPVVQLSGVDDHRAKLLNVALNRIGGEWDYDKLGDLLGSLVPEMSLGDMSLTGYNESEIGDILHMMGTNPVPPQTVTEGEVQASIDAQARAFIFKVSTDAESALCREVLAAFGMTGPGDAVKAFVAAMTAAKKHAPKARQRA